MHCMYFIIQYIVYILFFKYFVCLSTCVYIHVCAPVVNGHAYEHIRACCEYVNQRTVSPPCVSQGLNSGC